MNCFKDSAGREWTLEANYGSYARVKASTGVNLMDIATEDRKSLVALADPFTLGAVIWTLIEPQADARGITPESFNAALNGTVLHDAYNALIDEMIFFCHPRQRKLLTTMVERLRAVEQTATEELDTRMAEIEREIDAELARLIPGSLGTNSREYSASTPPSGPSESSPQQSKDGDAKSGTIPLPS